MSTDPHNNQGYPQQQNSGGYPGQPYGNGQSYGNAGGQPPNYAEASKHSQLSLVFGIVGLFFLGIVFGPLAIVQAKKAERLGVSATAGKVLGWISLIWSIIAIILFLAFAGVIFASMGA